MQQSPWWFNRRRYVPCSFATFATAAIHLVPQTSRNVIPDTVQSLIAFFITTNAEPVTSAILLAYMLFDVLFHIQKGLSCDRDVGTRYQRRVRSVISLSVGG